MPPDVRPIRRLFAVHPGLKAGGERVHCVSMEFRQGDLDQEFSEVFSRELSYRTASSNKSRKHSAWARPRFSYNQKVKTNGHNSCLNCRIGQAAIEQQQACPFVPRRRRVGELLYLQGETATTMWYVKRGVVVLRRATTLSRGRGVARCIRPAGSLIGVELLAGHRYVDTAEAGTDVTLCGVPYGEVDRWIGSRSPARALLELSMQASLGDGALMSRSAGTVVERLAAWLLEHEEESESLALPRRVIAELLGVRPETLSRALAELRRR